MHALAIQTPSMTLEEWADLPEDVRGELVDGVLVEEEAARFVHEAVVLSLGGVLHRWARSQRGFAGGSNADLAVSQTRGRHPDICVFLRQRPPASGLITNPPDLLVEVVSPSPRDARRDRVEKLHEYAAFGVRSYWIVDPPLRTLEVYELGADGRYVIAVSASSGQVEPSPGLVIDLDALWAEVDELEAIDAIEPTDPA